MTKIMHRLLAAALVALLALAPARAQFADQATWGGTATGTNAQAITISNAGALADLLGVHLKFIPGNNTGATTLAVSGLAATAVKRVSSAGLLALCGGEFNNTQIAEVVYDGTVFELLNPVVKGPTYQYFTTGSGATYTTPCGATFLNIKETGGGGGGGASASSGSANLGTGGTASSFNSITATGGGGGNGTTSGGAGVGTGCTSTSTGSGTAIWRSPNAPGSSGSVYGSANSISIGGPGGYSIWGGAASGSAAGVPAANSGSGGGGAGSQTNGVGGGGGGCSGESLEFTISSPAATYLYTVGPGGAGGTTSGGGGNGATGATGRILVTEYYN